MNQTPLNPDALEAAAGAVIDASFGQELPEAPIDLATAAVSAYLAVAQPEVNSVEELDALPEGTTILDKHDCRGVIEDGWVVYNSNAPFSIKYVAKYFLPARVLYRPESS